MITAFVYSIIGVFWQKLFPMKTPIAIVFSILMVICVVSSCSKSDAPAKEGAILTRYKTTFRDTIIFHYIYDRDANNKIISMRDSTWAYEFKTNLVYGSNNKVSKIEFWQGGTTAMGSYELEYNSTGRISKRKILAGTNIVPEEYNVYVYDGTGHLIIDSQFIKANNGTYKPARVGKFQYTADNISVAEDYDLTSGAAVLHSKLKYEYDNSVNPFKDMEYEYYINEAGSAAYTVVMMSANNVLKMYQANGNGGWDVQYTSTYTYNSNNYALKVKTETGTASQRAEVEYSFQ